MTLERCEVRWTHRKLPVARDEGLLIEHVADEVVVYDSESKEAHCLSPLPAVVFTHCDGYRSVEELAEVASVKLGEETSPDRVVDALMQLEERGLLKGGINRRQMLRRSAVAGAAVTAAPLISSVFAPAALAANSATCGPLICCPCCTGSGFNKDDCCFIKNVTVNCQCVSAQGDSTKKCKPAGNSAPSDAYCASLGPPTPEFLANCAKSAVKGTACQQQNLNC
jgi:hypothetical protein